MKRFEIKVYQRDWTFKNTIRENKILSDISFDMQKNWWQWELNLTLNEDFNYSLIVKSDFIKVFLYDENFTNWQLIYTWIVEEIYRNYKESENTVELVCRWLASLLTRVYYNQTWYTFTKTDTASNILKSIITYFNTVYTWNWLNNWWIVNTVWNVTIDFDYTTCFDAVNNVVELTNSFWSIWPDWTVYFNSTWNLHKLNAGYNVQSIDIQEDSSEIVNKVIVNYNWWTYTTQDNASITANWLFEKVYDKTNLNLASATSFANEVLSNNQTKQKVQIEINNKFIFENLKVWDTIKVRNIDYLIQSTIEKINYNTNICTVYLDAYDSLWKILINK